MKRLIATIMCTLMLAPTVEMAAAQDRAPSADACREEVNHALAKEQRLYRIVLFGQQSAETTVIGSVFYDEEGNAWYKAGESEWRSTAKGFENTTWSDTQVDNMNEHAGEDPPIVPRRGIFDTKRTLTSDLIPYMLQSVRALQCRLDLVCKTAVLSLQAEGDDAQELTDVEVPGCIVTTKQSFPGCHLAHADKGVEQKSDILTYCEKVAGDLLKREAVLLKFAVEYDAAYRSVLQLAGIFDSFLEDFRWTLTGSIRQVARLVGWLNGIPCFLASCEDTLPSTEEEEPQP